MGETARRGLARSLRFCSDFHFGALRSRVRRCLKSAGALCLRCRRLGATLRKPGFRDQALAGSGGGAAVGSGLLLLRNLQANRPGPEAGMLKRCLARCGNRVAAALNPAPVWPVNDPGYAVVPALSTRTFVPD